MLDLLQKSIAQYVLYGEETSDEFVIHRLKVESATRRKSYYLKLKILIKKNPY